MTISWHCHDLLRPSPCHPLPCLCCAPSMPYSCPCPALILPYPAQNLPLSCPYSIAAPVLPLLCPSIPCPVSACPALVLPAMPLPLFCLCFDSALHCIPRLYPWPALSCPCYAPAMLYPAPTLPCPDPVMSCLYLIPGPHALVLVLFCPSPALVLSRGNTAPGKSRSRKGVNPKVNQDAGELKVVVVGKGTILHPQLCFDFRP